ncbi:phosphoribosylamine--glycine ligase [Sphingomonas jejuensis]|uniref:Phosphoribosylamine--glycine ligase n=1 Tax=Sphingomonas jejuensis TaxID=904715 RepID=A0ABX0XMS9_9SPHN|nr:phosphoribosylamine--glycine ligase [Sphingomonas jejuensis]NJC34549.1 phosphoribosylamine--glycine ligase [Sphingomonas jejuensis]
MNVLLLGSGGREHALAWKLAQSPSLGKLFAAPGNPGIADHARLVVLDPADHAAVTAFARAESIGLVVVGPEAPLVDGLADSLRAAGVPVFGPSAAAARLEGSKAFTKEIAVANGIPTADAVYATSPDTAAAALDRFGVPVVVKADGLAAGKGVVVAATRAEADAAVAALFADGTGAALIEQCLVGEEASLFALSDGSTVIPFGTAQDHKRVGDGDTGPNTGGMGAYSPAPVLTPELELRAMREIVEPTVRALADAGTPFVGVLYAGLMLTAEGPKLIEYNVRFGDPEAQVLMPRVAGDLVAILHACATGGLAALPTPRFSDETALGVVIAADGYPGTPRTGGTVGGLEAAAATGATVFHAGTRSLEDRVVASGGRVLCVVATGADARTARDRAYQAVDMIDFPDGFCRRDIGWRAIQR